MELVPQAWRPSEFGLENKTRIYQASTSELFGKVQEVPQTEKTLYPDRRMVLPKCMPTDNSKL